MTNSSYACIIFIEMAGGILVMTQKVSAFSPSYKTFKSKISFTGGTLVATLIPGHGWWQIGVTTNTPPINLVAYWCHADEALLVLVAY